MKSLFIVYITLLATACAAQDDTIIDQQANEFYVYDNGLIYDSETIQKLRHIVDSLNLPFRQCQPHAYESVLQGFGTFVTTKNRKAVAAIHNNMAFADFMKNFPGVKSERVRIYQYKFTDYLGEKMVVYASFPLPEGGKRSLYLKDVEENNKTTGWIAEKGDGEDVLFIEELKAIYLPGQYAELLQYVDCIVDTSSAIYLDGAKDELFSPLSPGSKTAQYLKLATDFEQAPTFPEDVDNDSPFFEQALHKYQREYAQWNNKRLAFLDNKMKEAANRTLLKEAAEEAFTQNHSNETLEFYVERYLSPAQALNMKRHRRVTGFCSQDSRPRDHAKSICRLAAKTAQWDIFLRAHLDIMNDNFARASDGSYAWSRRGTYLKELEALDIDAVHLLIGTCIRSSTVSANHYNGDISRVGRALAESDNPDSVEVILLKMIEDENLDIFNRLLMLYVFNHYNYNLPAAAKSRKQRNSVRLKEVAATMPDDVSESLVKLISREN